MASTFTTRLNLEKPGTGEQDGTWGTTLNDNLDDIDEAVAGYIAKSVAGASDVTLVASEYRNQTIECTGTLTGNINVIVPATERTQDFINSTSGSFSLTVKTSGGTGIAVPQGGAARLFCDGTNVEQVLTTNTTAISTIVEDTTPELGGVLDTNDNAINESEGSDVASATATNIWATDGNTVHVTGTTTIVNFGTAPRVGAIRRVIFDDALTLTDSSAIILPGDANITTAAGDVAFVYAETTTIARVMAYTKADGTPVISTTVSAASVAQQQAGSSTSVYTSPGRQHQHDSAIKAWCAADGSGTPALDDSYNMSSITDNATGNFTFNLTNSMDSTDFAAVAACFAAAANSATMAHQTFTTSSVRFIYADTANAVADPTDMSVILMGDLA